MMRHSLYDSLEYKNKQAEITKKYWQLGKYNFFKSTPESKIRQCKNPKCFKSFSVKQASDRNQYCSSRCAALINNLKRRALIIKSRCLNCNGIPRREGYKYCSNQCQQDYSYNSYIKRWKQGIVSGSIGITTKILSGHLKRYLRGKYGEKCSICAWSQKHPLTGKVPIEIDHIDGNAENNKEENLRLICPNCHSLTPNFRNLNKGRGRAWRLIYINKQKASYELH